MNLKTKTILIDVIDEDIEVARGYFGAYDDTYIRLNCLEDALRRFTKAYWAAGFKGVDKGGRWTHEAWRVWQPYFGFKTAQFPRKTQDWLRGKGKLKPIQLEVTLSRARPDY